MKLTLQTQLMPDRENASKLKAAVERFNEAATWLAGVAFERRLSNKFELQKLCYAELRKRFGLPADMAIRCISQVCEAYKRDKDKRPRFRKHAAVPYSMGKNIGFKGPDRVSISTLKGRVVVPYIMGKYQAERFGWSKGQCDLVLRKDGKWFLLVTVDVPEETKTPATDFLGVDLGVTNIAVDEDGDKHSSEPIEKVRQRCADRRKTLDQAAAGCKRRGKRPRNIRRAKCRQEQKEARFRKDVNHQISKKLVAKAKGTGRGDRPRKPRGDTRPDTVSQAATSQNQQLVFLPVAFVRGVQGRSGRCADRVGRPSQHQQDLPRMRALRESQSQEPERIRVSPLWVLRERRLRWRSEHRFPSEGRSQSAYGRPKASAK